VYVLAWDASLDSSQPRQFGFTALDSPTQDQPYSILALPAGSYGIYAYLDPSRNGILDASVGIAHTDAPRVDLLQTHPAAVDLTFSKEGSGAHLYWRNIDSLPAIVLNVERRQKFPVSVYLLPGPHFPGGIDLARDVATGQIERVWSAGDLPQAGDHYQVEVRYSDDSVETLHVGLTDPLPLPVLTTPSSLSGTPTFNWSMMSPSVAACSIEVIDYNFNDGAPVWVVTGLPPSQTQIVYNQDGTAMVKQLPSGSYLWAVFCSDSDGNVSATSGDFDIR
jgi:hypothetical protein